MGPCQLSLLLQVHLYTPRSRPRLRLGCLTMTMIRCRSCPPSGLGQHPGPLLWHSRHGLPRSPQQHLLQHLLRPQYCPRQQPHHPLLHPCNLYQQPSTSRQSPKFILGVLHQLLHHHHSLYQQPSTSRQLPKFILGVLHQLLLHHHHRQLLLHAAPHSSPHHQDLSKMPPLPVLYLFLRSTTIMA